jgi:hypothetical protein
MQNMTAKPERNSPRYRSISDRLAAIAEQPVPEDERIELRLPKGATYGYALALAQFRTAIRGKTDAASEIREAIEGKSGQRVKDASGPVVIRVVYDRTPLHGLEAKQPPEANTSGGVRQAGHARSTDQPTQ